MKKLVLLSVLSVITTIAVSAQEKLPYAEIPDYPVEYAAGTVLSRLIDGLGFRYYWATDSLRAEDLSYRPNEDARTSEETLNHILGLTQVIVNTSNKKVHESLDIEGLSFEMKRRMTLNNIQEASNNFRVASDLDMEEIQMVFQNQNGLSSYPLWNLINGPIADAIWHVGQVVSFRRSSGNPFNSKVSVLRGRLRD